eukprot:2083023-Pleurochrysis_carterae.AAC.6
MPLVGGADPNGTASGYPTDLWFNRPYRASPTGLESLRVAVIRFWQSPCPWPYAVTYLSTCGLPCNTKMIVPKDPKLNARLLDLEDSKALDPYQSKELDELDP